MIRNSVRKIGKELESLARKDVPLAVSLEIVARRTKSVEELVVIEVIREVCAEMHEPFDLYAHYAESRSRSA